jgi:flagellar motor switch protein FliM
MSEILTQEEIESLLNAVRRGGLPPAPVQATRGRRNRNVLPYDFRRANRISKDQVRTLQMLHEGFARTLSSSLSAYLRSLVEAELMSVEQVTYGEFMMSVVRPSTLAVLEMRPLKGGAVLDVSPHVVFPMIDRVLGGPGRAVGQIRELTEIERTLVDRIFRRILLDLEQAWQQVERFDLQLLRVETNPQFVQLTSPNDTAILVDFDLRMGESQGGMSLCLPFATLEPVLPLLVAQRWFGSPAGAEAHAASGAISQFLQRTALEVRAQLGTVQMPIDRVTRLQPGDVIPLAGGRELSVTLEVQGRPRFLGRAGQRHGKRAVEITGTLDAGGSAHA